MHNNTQHIVLAFIDQIWNKQDFEKLDSFLHPAFKDHSLPPSFSPDKEGLKNWILATGVSFEHFTEVEEQVTENEKSILKIRMRLKHIGPWRGIEATGTSLSAIGYRFYQLSEGKIIAHWALIDGQALENQLRGSAHGCKVGV